MIFQRCGGKKSKNGQLPFFNRRYFSLADELSDGVDVDAFCKSFLVQPDLFIRIRPHTRITALKKAGTIKTILPNDW
jgi:hypothetical protein